ncbi:hypothetical protein Tco_1170288, partial [Tanacetum coccineum]
MYEMAPNSAVAGSGMSVCDFEEVHYENGIGWEIYGGLLLIVANSSATTVSIVGALVGQGSAVIVTVDADYLLLTSVDLYVACGSGL